MNANVASCPPDNSEHDGRALHWPVEKTEEVRLTIGCYVVRATPMAEDSPQRLFAILRGSGGGTEKGVNEITKEKSGLSRNHVRFYGLD